MHKGASSEARPEIRPECCSANRNRSESIDCTAANPYEPAGCPRVPCQPRLAEVTVAPTAIAVISQSQEPLDIMATLRSVRYECHPTFSHDHLVRLCNREARGNCVCSDPPRHSVLRHLVGEKVENYMNDALPDVALEANVKEKPSLGIALLPAIVIQIRVGTF